MTIIYCVIIWFISGFIGCKLFCDHAGDKFSEHLGKSNLGLFLLIMFIVFYIIGVISENKVIKLLDKK